jgi:hypothetical protein
MHKPLVQLPETDLSAGLLISTWNPGPKVNEVIPPATHRNRPGPVQIAENP